MGCAVDIPFLQFTILRFHKAAAGSYFRRLLYFGTDSKLGSEIPFIDSVVTIDEGDF
jgi:hypothetical protein